MRIISQAIAQTRKLKRMGEASSALLALRAGAVNYIFRPSPGPATGPCVVLLGGTAQTIHSLVGHHHALTTEHGRRCLLHFELRGQGRTTSLPLEQCGLDTHVDDMRQLLDASHFAVGDNKPVDLVGFSFGGRVALAVAATMPHRVRRLVVTGVPADRGATGRVILKAWSAALRRGDLEGFLWQSVADAHRCACACARMCVV